MVQGLQKHQTKKKKDTYKTSKLGCWPLPNWNFTVTLDKVCQGKKKEEKKGFVGFLFSEIMGDTGRMIRKI